MDIPTLLNIAMSYAVDSKCEFNIATFARLCFWLCSFVRQVCLSVFRITTRLTKVYLGREIHRKK